MSRRGLCLACAGAKGKRIEHTCGKEHQCYEKPIYTEADQAPVFATGDRVRVIHYFGRPLSGEIIQIKTNPVGLINVIIYRVLTDQGGFAEVTREFLTKLP